MSKKSQVPTEQGTKTRKRTPTLLLELPLQVSVGQAARLRGHLEAGRQFYNAVLSEGQQRLRRMRADPAWQQARAIPRAQKQVRVCWIAEHLDAVLAQTLASRAYRAHGGPLAGTSPPRPLQKSGTRPLQHRKQAQ